MPAYSLDLRTRVVAAYRHHAGARQAAVAALFGVSVSSLKKMLRHERQTGSLVPKPASGGWVGLPIATRG